MGMPKPEAESWLDHPQLRLVDGLKRMERSIIDEVIERCRGNEAAAARALGMHRRTLYRLLEDDQPGKVEQAAILAMTPDAAAS